jgi:tripartite-type tricarboxylate transporter receptor subunit TctC
MATVGSQVNMMFTNISSTLPLVKDGQLKVLTITSPQRSALLPDTPTVAESGLKDYQVYEWNGMFVPKGTPAAVVDQLQAAVRDVLKEPNVKAKFDSLGADIVASGPDEFGKFLKDEFAKWKQVAAKSGLSQQ